MKKNFHKTFIIKIGLISFIGLTYLILFLQIINNQKIALGIKIFDSNLGGRNIFASEKILKNQWINFTKQETIFSYKGYNWPIKLSNLGFNLNSEETINKAYKITHQANIIINGKPGN